MANKGHSEESAEKICGALQQRLEGQGSKVQSLIFSKERFTEAQAKAWAERHNFKTYTDRETEEIVRLRQFPPSDCTRPGGMKDLAPGVQGYVCPVAEGAAQAGYDSASPCTTLKHHQIEGGGKIGSRVPMHIQTDISGLKSADLGTVDYDVLPNDEFAREFGADPKEVAAFYDPKTNELRVSEYFQNNRDIANHELGHHVDVMRGGKADSIFKKYVDDPDFMRSANYRMGGADMNSGRELFAQGFKEVRMNPGYWRENLKKPSNKKLKGFFDALIEYSGYSLGG